MRRIEGFASEHSVAFSLLVTVVFILLLVVSTVMGAVWPGKGGYAQPGGILGRLISIGILLAALAGLGWLRPAGFASLGRLSVWLVTLAALVYAIGASAYALTGNFDFGFTDTTQTGLAALFIFAAATLEEVAFRGLVLYALVRVWGDTNRGFIKSILVASLFFSSIHLLDFLSGRPLTNVLAQTVQAVVLGVILGALVLISRSIYPAVTFHFALNLAGYLNFAGEGVADTPAAWLKLSLLLLPLGLAGIYLLRGVQTHRLFLRQGSVGG